MTGCNHRRFGTGKGRDRDITAFRPGIPRPRVSANPRPLVPARATAENRGFSTEKGEFPRETGLHLTLRWREVDSNLQFRAKMGNGFKASVALNEGRVWGDAPPAAYAFLGARQSRDPKDQGIWRLGSWVTGDRARLCCLTAGLAGSPGCFRFRPPATGNNKVAWRRSGAVLFAFLRRQCVLRRLFPARDCVSRQPSNR